MFTANDMRLICNTLPFWEEEQNAHPPSQSTLGVTAKGFVLEVFLFPLVHNVKHFANMVRYVAKEG